jgi:adenine C2-methylase RlmN of 23S rRNA A2503 and tRNA A37
MKMEANSLQFVGYDTLGSNGADGVRYVWKHSSSPKHVESAAFSQRSKIVDDNVCGYTTSVSSGCILRSMDLACKFCRTGMQLPFGKQLTPLEIAKQNVFMVLTDMHCSDHVKLRTNQREFAYMGQGEPGFSYSEIREAIQLTNSVMGKLGQTVFRHIIATSGVPHMIDAYVEDLRNNFFSSRTTIHLSLHGTVSRDSIMPINKKFPYEESLLALSDVSTIAKEKPCIGIMLLNNFLFSGASQPYTMDFNHVKQILSELDPERFRLSFCEFNDSADLGTFDTYDPELSEEILSYAQSKGFEAKLFSSFGKEEIVACGMLGGKEPEHIPSSKWLELEKESERLISLG